MSTKHTVGIWTGADETGKFNPHHSWHAENESALISDVAPIWANGKVIALVVDSDEHGLTNESELLANAKLITASPKLLAALKMVIKAAGFDQDPPADSYGSHAYALAMTAIAEAEGEPS